MTESNKATIRRLVAEVFNGHNLDAIDDLYTPRLAPGARRWIAPFLASFPDTRMEIVDLIAEGDKVVARFTCSGTQTGEWLGQPASGRRMEKIDEVSIFRFDDGKIAHAWSLEDTLARLQQLGLPLPEST
jgi:steroid delta-isomerase-like uncharacterized protein